MFRFAAYCKDSDSLRRLYEESDADLPVCKKLALTNQLNLSIKIDIVFTNAITEEL